MNSFTSIFKIIFRIGVGFALILIAAEIVLQFLPVKTGFKRPDTIAVDMPPHWQPNQSFIYSSGWRMDNPQTGWMNNKGYPTPIDFENGKKAVIVVGDSFVENQMNSWSESFMGLLEGDAPYPVYAFGLSGAQAADYIALAHYAAQNYEPQHMIIVLQNGDFASAIEAYQPGHYFMQKESGIWSLDKLPYSHRNARIRNFLKRSALIRYVMMNLKLQDQLKLPRKVLPETQGTFQDNSQDESGLVPRVAFFIDEICLGSRNGGYKITLASENNEIPIDQFKKIANQCASINWVDIRSLKNELLSNDPFLRLTHAPYDAHWNAAMHRIVYEAIKPTLPF